MEQRTYGMNTPEKRNFHKLIPIEGRHSKTSSMPSESPIPQEKGPDLYIENLPTTDRAETNENILPKRNNKYQPKIQKLLHIDLEYKSRSENRDIGSNVDKENKQSCCKCFYKGRNKIREDNRFSNLSKGEKSTAIKELWKRSIRDVIIKKRAGLLTEEMLLTAREIEYQMTHTPHCLILPGSHIKAIWDLIMLITIVYTCVLTPFAISFMDHLSTLILIIEYFVSVLFAIDIPITFCSSFYLQTKLITHKKLIAIHYLKTYLLFDIISCIPLTLAIGDETHTTGT